MKLLKLYLVAGLMFLLACYFSLGFRHGDEHFQIFEFAGYLLGWNGEKDMAWEFAARMRPSLQPVVTAGGIKVLNLAGISDPFFQAFLFKLCGAALLFLAIAFFIRKFAKGKEAESGWYLFMFCLTPYLAARYSSEGLSASMLIFTAGYLHSANRDKDYFIAGIFAGLAFLFRYQTGFALAGTGIWYLLKRNFKLAEVAGYVSGFILIFLLGTLSDRIFYGQWVIAPYNYFFQNIVLNKASGYGTDPWYYYLVKFTEDGLIIPGILALAACAGYMIRNPKDLLTWMVLIFLAGHTAVAHKESRFLFPIAVFIPFLIYDTIVSLKPFMAKTAAWLYFMINGLLIPSLVFLPASQEISLLKFIEKDYPETSFYLVHDNVNSPYDDYGLKNRFYGRKQPVFILQDTMNLLPLNQPVLWISKNCHETRFRDKNWKVIKLYQSYPEWITTYFDINHWSSRASILTLYELKADSTSSP